MRPPSGLSRPPLPPSSPLPDPGCAGRAQGAGGNDARRRKRKARRGPSPERSPLQLQPQVPSLLPAPQTRRWRRQRRKEAPVLQRHSALLTAATSKGREQRRRGRRVNKRPQPPSGAARWPLPFPTRRDEGAGPRCPITARRLPGPPSVRLPAPGCGKTPGGFCDPGGGQQPAFHRGSAVYPLPFSSPGFLSSRIRASRALRRELCEEL